MDRKTYMKNIYSKYWIYAREKVYGFSRYDKNLCSYICKNISKKSNILEVAIGTGYPFGNYFEINDYKVYGVDIAPILVEKCKKKYPSINCKVGDAENLEYTDNFFDCTYCFHSTSYFSNLNKVIDEMIRVTIPNGMIIFDIQNKNNEEVNQNYNKMLLAKKNGLKKLFRYAKNILKIILRKGVPDWTNVVHEVPTCPENVNKYLEKKGIRDYKILVTLTKDDDLVDSNKIDSFKKNKKIIFILRK